MTFHKACHFLHFRRDKDKDRQLGRSQSSGTAGDTGQVHPRAQQKMSIIQKFRFISPQDELS